MDTPDSKTPSSTTTNKNNIDNNSRSKLINPSSSDSPAFQDSPIYSYISNLSPILPVKAAPVAQGFPGLASPPLTFTSPRVNLRTSFLNRQLYSSTSSSEFFDDNDKSQKNSGNADNLAKVNNFLKISSISDDKKNCNEENSVQVPQHNASGLPGEFIANPMECTDFFRKRLSVDFPQSVGDGCLVQKNNVTADDKVLDGSALPKVAENAQAKSRAIIKLVKLEPKRKISASSGCSSTLIKLSSGYTSEASHLEFGSLRRCLFDENQRKYSSDGSGSGNPNDDLKSIQEVANTSPSGTIGGRQMISLSKSVNGAGISPTARNYPVAISGIGLHLNSVLNPLSIDNATVDQQLSEKKVVRVIGKTSVFVASNQSDGIANAGSIPTNLSGKVSPCSGETHQNEVSLDATLGSPLASDAETHSKDLILVKADDPSANVHDKRKFDLESAETNMKVNLGNPTKKRKKSLSMPDGDTSKRCNCKRSKCVKLYCDCFAAGLFCGESCACQGCFNRGEFEGTVLETRQQIESRNPLAFVPKVVQPVIDSPASAKEVGNLSTPTSARHKRGCNCKKSMCLKKYCECYQSNVGCSDGCRCEGCKNVYGRREDDSFAKELMINKIADETPGDVLDEKQQGLTGSSDNMKSRLHNLPHVTPLTPALQCSDQKKIGLKSRLSFQRFLQSSTSDHHETLPSKDLPACPGSSLSDGMVLEENSMKPTDFENVAEPKTSIRSGLPPPSSHLCWRSSPMTPITESARSEYLQDFNYSGSKHCEMLEDDTPEILRDSATPSKSVKVRSPSKKRVSPPHNHKPSPESIKICHKFVLRSVPSFPPLTPYSKNRGNNNTRESLD